MTGPTAVRRSSARRRWVVGAALTGAIAVLAWAAVVVLGRDPSATDSALIGKPVPNVVLDQVEGNARVPIATAGRVTVINFWAPWCVPCLGEHRMLNGAASAYDPGEVQFVGVAFQSDDAEISNFLSRVGRNVPTLRDRDGLASIEFGVVGVPETFVVDRFGVVRARVAGPLDRTRLDSLVNDALREQPPDAAVSSPNPGTTQPGTTQPGTTQ